MVHKKTRMEQDQLAAEIGMESVDKEKLYNPVGTILDFIFKAGDKDDHFKKRMS